MGVNRNNTLLFALFLLTQIVLGQTLGEKLIHGRVFADSAAVGGINVVNLVNEKSTITNANGEFFILAKAEDLLILAAVHLEYKRKLIEEEDLNEAIVIVNMIPKATELKEVIVKDKTANSISIISGRKSYTPAERKLYTARSGIIDRPLNWLSGRTAMLRKEVEVEKKERLLYRVEVLYTDEYYTETLKIAPEYIRDFQYFIIDDSTFVSALNAKNKITMLFLISKLAVKYNQLMGNDK